MHMLLIKEILYCHIVTHFNDIHLPRHLVWTDWLTDKLGQHSELLFSQVIRV